jgi:protein-tyrosine phosphatase
VTSTVDRRLAWDACLNVRDLGGISCANGVVRTGRLVRASILGGLTAGGREAMLAHGIRTVLDLRGDDEVAETPSPFAEGVTYRRVPLSALRMMALHEAAHERTLAEELRVVSVSGGGLAECFAAIAESEPGILLHCTAGRDRTGFIVALLLAALGAADEDIVADYVSSDVALVDEYARFKAANPDRAARVDEGIAKRAWVMDETLAAFRDPFGGAAAYLASAGVGPAVIAAIAAKVQR